jgi:hypothetical protein
MRKGFYGVDLKIEAAEFVLPSQEKLRSLMKTPLPNRVLHRYTGTDFPSGGAQFTLLAKAAFVGGALLVKIDAEWMPSKLLQKLNGWSTFSSFRTTDHSS